MSPEWHPLWVAGIAAITWWICFLISEDAPLEIRLLFATSMGFIEAAIGIGAWRNWLLSGG